MVTFEQFNECDSCTLELNQAGIDELRSIVETYANFEWSGDHSQIEALSYNDCGFQADGTMKLELSYLDTKTGTPFTYELNFDDHYDCEITSKNKC